MSDSNKTKRVKYNVLPADGLRKGDFVLEANKMKLYAQSVIEWIQDIPTGVAIIQEHEHGTKELGRVVDAEWNAKTGLWVIAEFTEENFNLIEGLNIKRVSGDFTKNFSDRRGNKRPLVMFELSLVTAPMFHDQLPAQLLTSKLPLGGSQSQTARLTLRTPFELLEVQTSNQTNIGDKPMKNVKEETKIAEELEATNLEAEPEVEPEVEMESEEEPEEEVDPMEAVLARLLRLEGEMAELRKAYETKVEVEKEEAEEAPEKEEAEVSDEEKKEIEDEEKSELRARLDVLRDVNGKNLSGWTEDELVRLKMTLPEVYAKKVSEFGANKTTLGLPNIKEVQTKVLGGKIETKPLDEETAILKAKEAFEAGGSFFETWSKLRG
jgi:hypothetical protein